jgi:hypothetical protein
MMKTLAGVMIYVCFFAVVVATLADTKVHRTVGEAEVDKVRSDFSGSAQPYRAEVKVKAVRIEVVVSDNCFFCRRLEKTTIPALEEAGYEVKVVDKEDDKRETKRFPTIYYFGKLGTITRTDVGYRTYEQVIKYLEKP